MRLHQLAFAGESVPRTCRQTIVTAENAIANSWTQLNGNRSFQFNREVGDAKSRVQLERRGDGARGTGRDAACAGAAAILFRLVRFQFERGKNLSEKNPVAQFPADNIGVLADESNSRALSKVPFQLPLPGCTTRPAGLSMTSTDSSSCTTLTAMACAAGGASRGSAGMVRSTDSPPQTLTSGCTARVSSRIRPSLSQAAMRLRECSGNKRANAWSIRRPAHSGGINRVKCEASRAL